MNEAGQNPVSFERAIAILLELAGEYRAVQVSAKCHDEELPLLEAVGRIASRNYQSDQNIPAFGNSSMDGFAVHSEQTQLASVRSPLSLTVLGSIVAGDSPLKATQAPEVVGAWEIMTGAPLPFRCNGVVKIEDVQVIRNSQGQPQEIVIRAPVEEGQNYRGPGEDFRVGTSILKSGTCVMPEHVLALATLGISQIRVVKKPKVLVVSTGRELADASGPPIESGQIRNSTAPFLISVLEQLGTEAVFMGTSGDDPAEFMDFMKKIVESQPDIIITTGGVSMGKHDYVKSVLVDMGAEICFHKILMRPGKPNLLARFKNGPVVFGLPGNPVSTVVGLRFLVEPFLREWTGRHQENPSRAQVQSDVDQPEGLRCFFKARLDSNAQLTVLPGQASFMIRPLLEANVWAVLPERSKENEEIRQGSWIDVYPLYPSPYDRRSPFEAQSEHKQSQGCC